MTLYHRHIVDNHNLHPMPLEWRFYLNPFSRYGLKRVTVSPYLVKQVMWSNKVNAVGCIESATPKLVGNALEITLLSLSVLEIFDIEVCIENPIPTPFLAVFGVKHPQIVTVESLTSKDHSVRHSASFELFHADFGRRVWFLACFCLVSWPLTYFWGQGSNFMQILLYTTCGQP